MRPLLALLAFAVWASAAVAQDAPRLVFTTAGAGVATGVANDPFGGGLLSASITHARARGWRTLSAGASMQAELFGREEYAEVHVGYGATAAVGPVVLSATAGPAVGWGSRGVYGPTEGPPGETRTTLLRTRTGLGVGLRAMGQALLILAPELGVGVEVSHDQNTLLPTSGARLVLSLGTHRRSLLGP